MMKKDKIKKIINTDNLYEYIKGIKIPVGKNKKHKDILWNKLEQEELLLEKKSSKEEVDLKKPIFNPIFKYSLSFTSVFIIIFMSIFIFTKIFIPGSSEISLQSSKGTFYLNNKTYLKEKIKIKKGTQIKTDKDSEINLKLGNDCIVFIDEKSKIEFISNHYKKENQITKLYLYEGSTECSVKLPSQNSAFEIQTDLAYFTVKGTKFRVEIMDDKNIKLKVNEGIVEINNMIHLNDKNKKNIKKNNEIYKLAEKIINRNKFINAEKEVIVNKKAVENIQKNLNNIIEELGKNNSAKNQEIIKKKLILLIDEKTPLINTIEENKSNSLKIYKVPMTPNILLEEKNTFIKADHNNIYIASDKHAKIFCLDINSGKLKWEFSDERITGIKGDIALYLNEIIFTTPDHIFVLYKYGKLKISYPINDGTLFGASPIVNNNIVLIPGSQNIYIYNRKNIEILKNIDTVYGQLFLSIKDNNLYYLDLNSKKITHYSMVQEKTMGSFIKLKERSFIPPIIYDDHLYAIDLGNIYRYSLNDISSKPKIIPSENIIISQPLIHDDNFYFVANDGVLYKMNIKNFNSPRKITVLDKSPDPDKYLNKKPVLIDSKILCSSDQGTLFIYDINNKISQFIKLHQADKKNPLIGTPLKIKKIIYVIDSNCNIYRIKINQ